MVESQSQDILITMFSLPNVIFVIGGAVALVAILAGAIATVINTRAKERTRRELAAYVAAGSLDPDKAVALLNAGRRDEAAADEE